MEPTQLQLVFNVITITGVTSLAGYCYLLKKENRKLTSYKADSHRDAPKAETVQDGLQACQDRRRGYPNLRFRPPQPMGEGPGVVDFLRRMARERYFLTTTFTCAFDQQH